MINEQRLLDTFLDYVRIDSESRHEAAMAKRLADDLAAMGCKVEIDASAEKTGSDTGNVIATLPGNAPGEPIAFFAHMDTVPPGVGVKPVVENGVIRSGGDTVLGADDKSGIAPIVEALRVLIEQDIPHPTIQAVFTVCEEVGMYGARDLDRTKLIARRAVVLDTGTVGKVVVAAPGSYRLAATVLGKKAHAGSAPELGVSAIQALADGISRMKLLRVDEETTANVGSFVSQFPNNIVPDRAVATFNCRSLSSEKLEAQVQHMTDCLQAGCDKYGAKLELEKLKSYTPYRIPEDDPLLRLVAEANRKLDGKLQLIPTGGGSDAHRLIESGLHAVVTGTGMAGAHSTQEHLAVADLARTARLVLEIIHLAGKEQN